jgi:hypothetical protein
MFAWYEIRTQVVAWDHKWVRHVLFHILRDLVDLLSYVRSISPTASSPITNVGLDQKKLIRPGQRRACKPRFPSLLPPRQRPLPWQRQRQSHPNGTVGRCTASQ